MRTIPKERAENEWAKKTFSGVRSTTPRYVTERGSVNARRRHYFRKFRGPGKPYNFATSRPDRFSCRHLWGRNSCATGIFKGPFRGVLFRSFKSSLCHISSRSYDVEESKWNELRFQGEIVSVFLRAKSVMSGLKDQRGKEYLYVMYRGYF